MTNNPCDGLTLPPLGTCTVTFSFSPTAGGAYTDTFDVTSNDHTRASITGRLDGSGFDRTISLAPSPVDFGNVPLNQSSSMWLVVTNNGTTSLTIGTVAGVDPLAAPFSILSDNCSNSTVVAGGNCSIQLLFIPTVTGLLTDTFDIPSNDPATPSYNVSVSGTGATGSLSVGSANMGSATIGTTVTKAVVVNNIGGVNLTIGTIGVSDPLGAPFSLIGNTCNGATLAPATTCELTLGFSPTVEGAASDTFDIPSNDPSNPVTTVTVSGDGFSPSGGGGGGGGGEEAVGPGSSTGWLYYPPHGATNAPLDTAFIWMENTSNKRSAVGYSLIICDNADLSTCDPINIARTAYQRLTMAGMMSVTFGLLFGFAAIRSRNGRAVLLAVIVTLSGISMVACGDTIINQGLGQEELTCDDITEGMVCSNNHALKPDTKYYWQVTASSDSGGANRSETRFFTTRND